MKKLLEKTNMILFKTERIFYIGKFVYVKLFDICSVKPTNKDCTFFIDKETTYECKKVFWRFYLIVNKTYKK